MLRYNIYLQFSVCIHKIFNTKSVIANSYDIWVEVIDGFVGSGLGVYPVDRDLLGLVLGVPNSGAGVRRAGVPPEFDQGTSQVSPVPSPLHF